MKKEDIIALPNPHLRKKSKRVHVVNESTHRLINDMVSASLDWEDSRPHEISAALAAVQIDKLERVTVVRSDFDNKQNREFIALIDPEIIKYEGELVEDFEGCLSVCDIYGKVPRYTKIRVKAIDEKGNEIRFKAEGFLARVLQHEIDHMHGTLFVDMIKDKKNAFYKLDDNGELQPLDYEKDIKQNSILWD
jgi:peptide deformylase